MPEGVHTDPDDDTAVPPRNDSDKPPPRAIALAEILGLPNQPGLDEITRDPRYAGKVQPDGVCDFGSGDAGIAHDFNQYQPTVAHPGSGQ